jgi:hypothetical protein
MNLLQKYVYLVSFVFASNHWYYLVRSESKSRRRNEFEICDWVIEENEAYFKLSKQYTMEVIDYGVLRKIFGLKRGKK